jgi:hypothetical protein
MWAPRLLSSGEIEFACGSLNAGTTAALGPHPSKPQVLAMNADMPKYDRDFLLSAAKRNSVVELWEVERYGRDCFGDPDHVLEIVDDFEAAYGAQPVLYVTEVHEVNEPKALQAVEAAFDWSELRIYDVNVPGLQHGVLLGTRRLPAVGKDQEALG